MEHLQGGMPFKLAGKGLFLTWPQCATSREEILSRAQNLFGDNIKTYIIAQEKHQDGNLHIHAWFGLKSKVNYRKSDRIDLIGGKHGNYQVARSPKKVMEYCIKEDKNWLANFDVAAKIAAMTSKRKYIGTELIKNKRKLHEVVDDDPSVLYDLPQLKKAMAIYNNSKYAPVKGEFREVEVIVLWGEAGTGKSKQANEEGAYALASFKPEWWDGYDGHEVIHIEDYYGGLPYTRFLRILDGYKIALPIKGGFMWSQYTKVYITSNKPPSEWYSFGMTDALKRRINRVEHLIK